MKKSWILWVPRILSVPEDLDFLEQNLKKRYSGEAKMAEIVYHIRHKNGEVRTIKVISSTTLYKE